MTQKIQILTLAVLATAEVKAERFITAAGAYAAPGGNAIGVSESDGTTGALVPTIALGTAIVTAAAPIAVDQRIEVGADGKAVPHSAGVPLAAALQAAAADGDRIEVFLLPN